MARITGSRVGERGSGVFFWGGVFLGPHLWHMEVPRSNWRCSCQPMPQSHQIWASFVTYIAAHSNAGSSTHWARPGIEPTSSWILVGFLIHQATMGIPGGSFWYQICSPHPSFCFSADSAWPHHIEKRAKRQVLARSVSPPGRIYQKISHRWDYFILCALGQQARV